MNIAELCNEVGIDKLRVQFLDQCATDLNYSEKRGTKITFGTDQPIDLDGTRDVGVVVWLPRDAVRAAIAKAKGSYRSQNND